MNTSTGCPRCGTPLTPGTKFCSECGNDVTAVGGDGGAGATAPLNTVDMEATLLEFLKQATVGEFEIIRELGRGGMAMVYLAKDVSLAREVAVKVMAPSLNADASMAERFVREAQTAASLSHPNIIPVYAVRQTANVTFFVMKYITGRPLDNIMEEVGPLPIDLASAIISQVSGALGYGHKRGIVHRDVKPGNIMIDDEGWAVVTDFGIAKVEQAEGLTQTGAAIGTPTYMSPEQCTAKPVTGASDQYSLGVLAYEMMTGRKPFDGDSVMSIMYAHVNEPPPPFLDERPDCPRELHDAIMRMLSKSVDDRFAHLEDLADAVSKITSGSRSDAARTEMISLAQSGVSSKVISNVRTPRSPVPLHSIQKSAVRTEGVRPSAETVQTPASAEAVDSGSLISSGQIVPPRKKPVGLIAAAAAVVVVGVGGLMVAAPWQTGDAAPGDPTGGRVEPPVGPTGSVAASVEIIAPITTVEEGGDLELTAIARDSIQTEVEVVMNWTTSDPSIAMVDGGLVAARNPGPADITVEAGGATSSVSITVTARPPDAPPPVTVASVRANPRQANLTVGETRDIQVTIMGSDGGEMSVRATWRSDDQTVARVSQGTITAVGTGQTFVTASRGDRSDQVRVDVSDRAVDRVTVTASPTSLEIGGSVTAIATVRAANNSVLTGRTVAWTTSADSVATVSGGTITAQGPGSARITATVDDVSGNVDVNVAAAAPIPPTEAESRSAIQALIANYHTAFQAGDIDAVGRAYAGMSGTQRDNWIKFFGDVLNLRVTVTPDPPAVFIDGNTAEVSFTTRYDFRFSGSDVDNELRTVMRFALQGTNWEMTEWDGENR